MKRMNWILGPLMGLGLAACQNDTDVGGDIAGAPAPMPAAEPAPMPATPAAPAAADATRLSTVEYSLINDTTWVNLFQGQDLSSFTEVGGSSWTIVDDYVEATEGTANGFLVTRGSYRDVHLMAEFWMSPDANSGIFMRCQDVDNIAAATCYEVNIFDQREDQTYRTGGIVNFAEPMVQMDAADRWSTFDITMEGDHIVVRMNDELMVDINDSEFAAGPIAFQWGAGTVRFRNIRLQPL